MAIKPQKDESKKILTQPTTRQMHREKKQEVLKKTQEKEQIARTGPSRSRDRQISLSCSMLALNGTIKRKYRHYKENIVYIDTQYIKTKVEVKLTTVSISMYYME